MTNHIAVAHKDYDVRGGGEMLAEELARTFDAPLFVGRHDEAREPPGTDVDIQELFDGRVTQAAIDHGGILRSVAYMLAWQLDADDLYQYDTVVTSGNEPLWWVPKDQQTVVAYTHATPRWQTDLWHQRDRSGVLGRVGGLVGLTQRVLYNHNTRRPDLWVANSDLVARRMERYWNIPQEKIRVVYPPVPTSEFDPDAEVTGDYYFGLSRLCAPKRFDEVFRAFAGTGYDLKIAGRGPAMEGLQALAAPHDNIELLGYISEAEKRRRLAEAKAFVFNAANEDFGIAPVEALASGTPVLGVREGFTQFQVLEGQNGYTYPRGALLRAVRTFEDHGVAWDADQLAGFAEKFNVEQFREGMRKAVARAETDSQVSVPWGGDGPPAPWSPSPVTDGGEGQ